MASFTKIGNRKLQSYDVSADYTGNISVLILTFSESFLELQMEFYQSLFHYDIVADRRVISLMLVQVF